MSETQPTVTFSRPAWRAQLALILLVVLALLGISRGLLYYRPEVLLTAYRQDQSLPLDPTERTTRNLRCLTELLPDDEILGFATDVSGLAGLEKLRQTQYVLAPRLIENNPDRRLVVAYFSQPLDTLPPQFTDYQVLQDCENGVFLLRSPLLP